MKLKNFLYVFSIVVFLPLISCNDEACCELEPEGDNKPLAGVWQLFESGYSPGGGYIVVEVAADPPLLITFNEDGTVISNMEGMEEYKFYALVDDPYQDGQFIAFFKNKPTNDDLEAEVFDLSYSFEITGDELKLYYRFCIEGCHLGFKRLEEN